MITEKTILFISLSWFKLDCYVHAVQVTLSLLNLNNFSISSIQIFIDLSKYRS